MATLIVWRAHPNVVRHKPIDAALEREKLCSKQLAVFPEGGLTHQIRVQSIIIIGIISIIEVLLVLSKYYWCNNTSSKLAYSGSQTSCSAVATRSLESRRVGRQHPTPPLPT